MQGVHDLARMVALLAPALSHGRRQKADLVTGSSRAFFTSRACTRVYVPFPLPSLEVGRISPARLATCGLALQSSPTKEALSDLPLTALRVSEMTALSLVEGEIAMAWAIEQFPGLEKDLRALLPMLKPTSSIDDHVVIERGNFVANGKLLIEAALRRARTPARDESIVPELLGHLPLDESARRSLRSYFRAMGRMPYSLRKNQPTKTILAIPVGGSGGARSRGVPPPDRG